MRVQVVRAWPRRAERIELELPAGATVADAIAASGWIGDEAMSEIDGHAVFGERVESTHVLQDSDRLELLRPLVVDPRQARRLRAGRAGR